MLLNWYKVYKERIDSLPEGSGIYVLSVLLKTGDFAVVYVGQSVNIKQRIKQHFSSNEANADLKKYLNNDYTFKISYALADENLLDGIEKFLIFKYSPRFNDQEGNGDSKYMCNTPNVIKFPN